MMLQQRFETLNTLMMEQVNRLQRLVARHEQVLLRVGIALLTLTGSALLAPAVTGNGTIPLIALGAYYGLIGVIILLRWPGIGFPILMVSNLLIPFALSTGTQTRINTSILLIILMIGLWLLEMVARQRQIALLRARPLLPLTILILGTFISLGFGQLSWYPTQGASIASQIGETAIYVLLPAATFLAAHRLSPNWLRWTVWVFLGVGAVYIVASLLPQPFRGMANRTFQRAVSDSLFWLWFVALAFGQVLLNRKLPLPVRGLLGLCVLLAMYVTLVVKQTWTSGWLPAFAAIGVVLLLVRPRWAIAAGVILGVVLLIRSQLASDLVMGGDNEYSLTTRVEAWKIMFQIIANSPIFGLGPANYYFYTPFYSILGYNVSFNSHNNYIDLLAQTGIVGFGAFIWFAAAMGRVLWRLRNIAPAGSFEQAFIFSTLGGLVGTLIAAMFGDWVLPFVYNIGMDGFRASVLAWVFFGAALMLDNYWKSHPITEQP